MEETVKKTGYVEAKAMGHILDSERQEWTSIAFIWIGTMICIPMLMVGGILATCMTVANIFWAALIGFAICCFIMVLGGIQGTDLGLPSTMCASKAFGDKGASYLMALVILIAQFGWFGVQTATCATAFNMLLSGLGVPNFPFWLSCIIWGGVMLVTAVYGFKFLKLLNYIAVPALIAACVYGAVNAVNKSGWETLTGFTPETALGLPAAISTVIGLFAVGTVINSDYSRYARSRKATIAATVIGVLPAAVLMIMIGAIMALAAGDYDITNVFASMGLPFLSMLVLILATWTTNTGNAYTAGLACMRVLRLKESRRPLVTMICGAIGTLVAIMGLADALGAFTTVLASFVPPVAGVLIADYWIIGRGKKENWYPVRGFNWCGIIAWACGVIVALFFSFYSPALDGILVCLVVYIVLYSLFGKTALAGGERMTIEEIVKE